MMLSQVQEVISAVRAEAGERAGENDSTDRGSDEVMLGCGLRAVHKGWPQQRFASWHSRG